jgi:phage-related protein
MAALNITSPDYFLLDGVSSATVGLYVDTPPIPPLAQQRYTQWQTGKDMDSSSPDDVWGNITLTFRCFIFLQNDDFDLSAVYNFVRGAKTLQYSRFADRYFKIQQIGGITPSQSHDGNKIALTIQFVCSPFKYHTTNPEITPEDFTITNPGTRYSRPTYKITQVRDNYGNLISQVAIVVNGQRLEVKFPPAVNDFPYTIVIDSERMIAYNNSVNASGGHDNFMRYTFGFFPFLSPGNNAILTEDCTVTVTGNWRDY